MTVRHMTPEQWASVRDNPIQRNTERHAERAHHLADPLPVHAYVYAAKLPSGELVKLDGHTRSFLWQNNVVPAPAMLDVTVIDVKSLDEAKNLYQTFDSRDALETVPDRVSGALHNIGLSPTSPLLLRGSIGTALKAAWQIATNTAYTTLRRGSFDVYRAAELFQNELTALDMLGLGATKSPAAMVAAILCSYRRHGDAVTPFWQAVINDRGEKSGGRMDGVQAVNEVLLVKRAGGAGGTIAACARILAAVERWLAGETFGKIPRPMDLIGYCDVPRSRFILHKKAAADAAE